MTKLHRQVAPGTSTSQSVKRVSAGRINRSASLPPRPAAPEVEMTGPDPTAGLLPGGDGAPLPAAARATFEQSLGTDLGAVRVHTGAESAQAAAAVGAHAFAVGNDIHFGAGKFQPDDPFGMHLLAHEVAHTQQQASSTPSVQHKLEVSQPGDASEHEADRAADAMVKGAPTRVSGGAGPAIARSAVGPVYNQAKFVGPNHDKTIDWNNPPQFYGLSGDKGVTLREQYRAHLREHLATEPDIIALSCGFDPEPIVARLAEIEQRQKEAAEAAAAAVGDAVDAVGGMVSGLFGGSSDHDSDSDSHVMGDVMEKPKKKSKKSGATGPKVDVEACRKALWRSSQRAIADTLSTETSDARYKKKGGTTYCNVYATDMVNAMGGYLPRVWYADLGIAKKMSQEEMKKNNVPVVELSANNIGAWLAKWGGDFGWTRTNSAKDAQAAANAGRVAIIQASKIDGVSAGHVGVIMAEGNGHEHTTSKKDGSFQPLQSQAGATNFEYSDKPTAAGGIGDTWWKGDGMKDEEAAGGNFYIYKGGHKATAVADAASMGKIQD